MVNPHGIGISATRIINYPDTRLCVVTLYLRSVLIPERL